jgi:NhaP-type Na+/H+ or K+/H+ antiporter
LALNFGLPSHLQNVGWVDLDGDFTHVTAELRKFALVIILIRAGLEMDPEAFKRIYVTILKLGLIPWTVECGVCAIMSHYLLDLPWIWAFLLGSIIAAVSPAVVVPCLFRLRTKGYGVVKGIPTLIIAVAGIDDAASVAVFGIISSILFSSDGGLGMQIAQAPVCILGGLRCVLGLPIPHRAGTWRRFCRPDSCADAVRRWTVGGVWQRRDRIRRRWATGRGVCCLYQLLLLVQTGLGVGGQPRCDGL